MARRLLYLSLLVLVSALLACNKNSVDGTDVDPKLSAPLDVQPHPLAPSAGAAKIGEPVKLDKH